MNDGIDYNQQLTETAAPASLGLDYARITMLGRGIGSILLLAATWSTVVDRPASAGSDTDQLMVSVVVQGGCSLNGGALEFGHYVPGQSEDLDAVGTIHFVNCSGSLEFALDGGGSANVAAREMSYGSDRLSYQIYRNPSRTAVWGSGMDAREVVLLTPQSGSLSVYGRVPGGQLVPEGVYSDVVNITLTF